MDILHRVSGHSFYAVNAKIIEVRDEPQRAIALTMTCEVASWSDPASEQADPDGWVRGVSEHSFTARIHSLTYAERTSIAADRQKLGLWTSTSRALDVIAWPADEEAGKTAGLLLIDLDGAALIARGPDARNTAFSGLKA